MTIQEIIASQLKTFEDRNPAYGDSYKESGPVFQAFFPKGITLKAEEEWVRFGAFFMIICKMIRYANAFKAGGHIDSAHDAAVYCSMLEELTRIVKEEFTLDGRQP